MATHTTPKRQSPRAARNTWWTLTRGGGPTSWGYITCSSNRFKQPISLEIYPHDLTRNQRGLLNAARTLHCGHDMLPFYCLIGLFLTVITGLLGAHPALAAAAALIGFATCPLLGILSEHLTRNIPVTKLRVIPDPDDPTKPLPESLQTFWDTLTHLETTTHGTRPSLNGLHAWAAKLDKHAGSYRLYPGLWNYVEQYRDLQLPGQA